MQSLRWSAGGGAIVLRAVLGACAGYCLQEISKGVERETRTTKERTMKLWVCLAALFMPVNVWAHDVDRHEPKHEHLGFDVPEHFECFVGYWHCRRELENLVNWYSYCVGRVDSLSVLLRVPPFEPEPVILTYFNHVQAEPISSRPGDTEFCRGQREACDATMGNFVPAAFTCFDVLRSLSSSAEARMYPPKKPKR